MFESFKSPPKSARPMVRWWWTGTDVEIDELRNEVRELDEAGFLGAEIQVFQTGSPSDLAKTDPERYRRMHRFMQPYYYEAVKAVLDEAATRDMAFDLTICSAWPAGGTHVSLEESEKTLLMGVMTLRGGTRYTGPLPRYDKPFFYNLARLIPPLKGMQSFYPEQMRLVRVVAGKPSGKPGKVRSFRPTTAYLDTNSLIDLTDKVRPDSTLDWQVPSGTWQVFALYAGPAGQHPLMDSRENPDAVSLVLDHLAAEPVRRHLEHHLGRARAYFGEHFGRALRGFFTDSLELSAEWSWAEDLLSEFKRRRGYDLAPYLPVCYVPGRDNKYVSIAMGSRPPCFDLPGDLGDRIRYDYERTVSDLFSERFVQAMTEWAEANGLQSRIQAYGIRADTLKAYGIAHIPETEQLFAGGMLDFMRLAGSAGAIYGKPLVTAESLVWNQRDYLTTPLKWKVAADRLFVCGINQMIYHGFPYQNPAFAYPGYDAFSTPHLPKMACFSSNMSRVNPFWEFFPAMNAYVTRCQHLLQQGQTVANVGIFYPLLNYPDSVLKREELVGGYLDELDAPLPKRHIGGAAKAKLNAEERWVRAQIDLADELGAHGYAYVHVNPESLLKARVEGAGLAVGAARLQVLILNRVERVSGEVARKLQEVAAAGIPILFVGQLPDRQAGFLNHREGDGVISAILNNLAKRYQSLVKETAAVPGRLRELGVHPGVIFDSLQPEVQYIHKRSEEGDVYFLRQSSREPRTVSACFAHPGCVPYLLDPWTGEATPAGQYEALEDGLRLELPFAPYGSHLIAFRLAPEPVHVARGDLPVLRSGESLVALAAKAGEYAFTLGDGAERSLRVAADPPPALPLAAWHLETELRTPSGQVTPLRLDLATLQDWREIRVLRHCSSPGVYTARIHLDERYLQAGLALTLDLGRVHDAAVVNINGHELAPLLVYPFAVDVTPYLRAGENTVRVTVTPTLRNQLIGWGNAGYKGCKQFRRRKELAPSGLIGPVWLRVAWKLEVGTGDFTAKNAKVR